MPNGELLYEADKFKVAAIGGTTNGDIYTGIKPESSPNVAILMDAGIIAPVTMCVKLHSMNFGCTQRGFEDLANFPVPCRMSVTSLDFSGNPLVTKSFDYEPKYVVKVTQLLPPKFTVNAATVLAHFDFPQPTNRKYRVTAKIGTASSPFIDAFLLLLPPSGFKNAVKDFFDKLSDYSVDLLFDDLVYETVGCPTGI